MMCYVILTSPTQLDTEQARVDTHTHTTTHADTCTCTHRRRTCMKPVLLMIFGLFLLTFAQCKARAQKTANILKLFSSVLVKALPLSLFTICTTPITVPLLTMGMHRMFRVV